jgi:hypothetical protein
MLPPAISAMATQGGAGRNMRCHWARTGHPSIQRWRFMNGWISQALREFGVYHFMEWLPESAA